MSPSPAPSCASSPTSPQPPRRGLDLLAILLVAVLTTSLGLRVALLVRTWSEADLQPFALFKTLAVGALNDMLAFVWVGAVLALAVVVVPRRLQRSRLARRLALTVYLAALAFLFLDVLAEWLFWGEFGVRFNFIAVDYIVYTRELADNVRESYPMPLLFGGVTAAAALTFALTRRWLSEPWSPIPASKPAVVALVLVTLPAVNFVWDPALIRASNNEFNLEIAKNGLASLVTAFLSNELDFERFYRSGDPALEDARLRELVAEDNATFVSSTLFDITRDIRHDGDMRRHNLVVIPVESLSASFLGVFGDPRGITPTLDRLAAESVFFGRFYATGTRTVRGLEAITLSLPPTPGSSTIKRPGNERMYSIGTVLRARGYDTRFLYGGYGYFDNMNYFFANNGFDVVDRATIPKAAVTFANAWGIADEHLYDQALAIADGAHARQEPFFTLVMTTSNHRPYTYPEGRIDIPSGRGRDGAVKYADYALGRFLDMARAKPWFDDTIFVILGDHCAASAGRTQLPPAKYHVPLLLYAPRLLEPRRIDVITSQIDLAPTLLGLLRTSYRSRFFGRDVLRPSASPPPGRALISTYQRLGLLRGDRLEVLDVKKETQSFTLGADGEPVGSAPDPDLLFDAQTYYHAASHVLKHGMHGDDVAASTVMAGLEP